MSLGGKLHKIAQNHTLTFDTHGHSGISRRATPRFEPSSIDESLPIAMASRMRIGLRQDFKQFSVLGARVRVAVCTTNHDSFTSFPSSVFINSCSYLSLPTTIVINHCCLRYRNWTLDGRWQTWKPRKMQRPYLWPGCTSTQAHKSSALCSLVAHQGSNLTHTTPTQLPQSGIAHLNASAPPA